MVQYQGHRDMRPRLRRPTGSRGSRGGPPAAVGHGHGWFRVLARRQARRPLQGHPAPGPARLALEKPMQLRLLRGRRTEAARRGPPGRQTSP